MRKGNIFVALVCLLGTIGWMPAGAQNAPLDRGEVTETAQVPSRIVTAINEEHLVKLSGNTHPLAQARFEQGLLEPSTRLERMMLILQRSPEQEQELAAFNERQYDQKSPDFHHWLHADEYGKLYGPSDADLAAIQNWLVSQGFTVGATAKGRTWIEFSGNVAQVQNAFHVEMHHYLVNGEEHIANDRDPQIPEALAPVVTGIASLHNFFPKPQIVRGNLVKRDRATGKITVLDPPATASPQAHASSALNPQLTFTDSNGLTHEDVTPFDFATIYNYLPLWNASKTGTGVKVAIAAGSDITLTDLANFRKTFGLPATTLNVIHNGADPGVVSGEQIENTLDVEMVSASAPGAAINLVVSANTSTSNGFQLSSAYIIDNETAPIMSASYGECELGLGTTGNAAFNKMWQQGATEGISIFISSGDQGSAGCTSSDAAKPNADTYGLQVNGMASSPYVTAVGGTDFTWSFSNSPASTYWNTANNANLATAKGYLPEVPWNSTCTNPLLLNVFTGEGTSEQLCNDALNSSTYDQLVGITGGSGGNSHCTTPSGSTASTCSGGYAKPSWQTGTGVPADGKRDVPDVSLFASGGFASGINGSAILFCDASSSPEKTCDYTNPSYVIYQEVGGTSASSPLMAGIMALVLQKTGSAQGLANPVLYKLYANQTAAATSCDSSTDTNASTCVFHDISQGTIAQVCVTGDLNCVTNTSGDQLGILSGYATTKGYDDAIGLGSLNVNNLVAKWVSTTAATPTITVSPTSLTFASTVVGSTTAAQVVTIKNTGTTAVTLTSETLTGTNATSFVKSATTCGTSLAAAASCTVSVEFKPTAAGALTASLSVADNATGSPQLVTLKGTATAASTYTLSVSPTSLAFASTVVGSTTAAQVVTIKNTGTAAVTLTSETLAGANSTSFVKSATTCGTSLAAAASCTVSIEFKPAAAGTLTASLAIADNATGSPQAVALSGTATAAATHTVSLSATTLTFASTVVGSTTAAQVVTIKNTGTAAVTLTSETITGTNATSFIKSATTCGTSLAAAASCTVSVEFKPAAAGTLTASLSIADNATGTPQVVALKGTATAATTPTVSLSATSIAFPTTIVGTTSDEQMVTLTNSSAAAVSISSITITGTNPTAFEYLTTCGTSLASKASCALYVAFKPASAAALSATLSIADTATGSPQKVTLTGTGAAAPSVKLSATSLAFPTTKSGSTSAAQSITLTNSGTAVVNLNSIALSGTNPTSFQEVTNCSPTLAAGASCVVYVAFSPKTTGALKATLSVVDNGAASPQSVALSGTGD